MATVGGDERLDFFSIVTAHSLALDEFCSVLDGIIAYEEAIAEGKLRGVDISALILSAHVLFKRKEFAYVEPNKRKRVYEVLLKFALKSLNQYGPKESLIFLMLVAQLCTGKDILYDNVVLLRGVVSTYLGSASEEKSETKADDKPAEDKEQEDTTLAIETPSASADELFEKFNSFGFAPEYYLKSDLYYSEHAVPEDDVVACLKQGRAVLKEMKGRKELLKFCLSLPVFKALKEHSKAPSRFLIVGASDGVATNGDLLDRVKQLYVAVQASLLVLTIPDTLEPLNEEHLSQVKELLCLLLQAAVAAYAVPVASLTKTAQPDNESRQQPEQQEQQSAAAATDKEEGMEFSKLTTAVDILQQLQSSKTVEMVCSMQNIVNALHAIIVSSLKACSCVESDIMESSRVSGHVLLNLWVLIAYNIFGGLQPLLTGKPVIEQDVPTGSRALTMSYAKLAGWSVDLVTKGFQVLCQLVQDLECDEVSSTESDHVIPFADQLDIFGSYTPWQRMRMLIASIPLVDVLFTLLCSSYKKAVQVVKSSSSTTISDSTESTSSAATAAATAAKPQSKKPDGSAKQPPDVAAAAAAATGMDKKDGEMPAKEVTPVEEHTGNSSPPSIASSDDICEYNLFSDEDTESDASLEPWPNFPLCGMQWSTPSDANFEQATPINVPAIPPPPPPLPPKRKVSLPKSEQVSAVMPRVPLLPPRGKTASSDTKLQDGARRKPALFIRLAQCVVECLLAGVEHTHHKPYQDYLRTSLSMEHVSQLAQVIQSVDTITSEEAGKYKQLMEVEEFGQFTEKLLQLVQELISSKILKHSLQDILLNELGLSTRCWPLHILPRSLFILARLLICRLKSSSNQQEDDPLCLSVWNGMLTSLETNASTDSKEGEVVEDLDVANLQLLLVVFHRLTPSSKSILLSRCVGALIKVAAVVRGGTVVSPLAVSRLLLVFDYMVHLLSGEISHFKKLLEQIDKNIFKRTQASSQSSTPAVPDHFSSPLEANYRAVLSKVCTKKPTEEDSNKKQKNKKTEQKPSIIDAMVPRFYEIRKHVSDDAEQIEEEEGEGEDEVEVIKLLLTYSESEGGYSDLYDALLTLMVTGVDDVSSTESLPSRILSAMATRHCFTLCWDLLAHLPPSGKFLKSLLDQNHFSVKDPFGAAQCLHSLRTCFKLSSQVIDAGDIMDALATAGQEDAEELVGKVTSLSTKSQTNSFAITVLNELCEDTTMTQPSLLTIIAVDTLINLLDIEISCFLPSTEVIPEQESKKPDTKASTDATDAAKDTKSEGKATDNDATKGDDVKPPAVAKKPALLTDEDRRNMNTISLLCSRLLPKFISYAHNFILSSLKECGPEAAPEPFLVKVYDILLSIAGLKSSSIIGDMSLFANYFPDILKEQLKVWSSSLLLRDDKSYGDKQRKEALFNTSLQAHLAAFAGYRPFDSSRSLKTTIVCLLKLCSNLQTLSPDENFGHFIAPLYIDAVGSFIQENKMEFAWGDEKSLILDSSKILIINCFQLINIPELQSHAMFCGILEDTMVLFECLLRISAVWPALSLLDVNDPPTDLASLIVASTKPSIPSSIACQGAAVLKNAVAAANKLVEPHLVVLCRHISSLASRPADTREWLRKLLFGHKDDTESSQTVANVDWLKEFIVSLVEEDCPVDRALCSQLLEHILILGGELLGEMADKKKSLPHFPGLLSCIFTLAPVVDRSYILIIQTLSTWIPNGMKFLNMEFEDNKVKESLLEIMASIVEYISNITTALQYSYDKEQYTTANELACDADSILHDTDSECGDDICVDDEESGAEDSDDESINSKLCTFTHTQREFTEQHWYHCHTCKLVDGTGVCTVCAKVCHKGHELSYSKCGSFFCDCGAKEDKSCQALVKRGAGTAGGSGKATSASDDSQSFAVPFASSTMKKTKKVSTHKKSKNSTGEKVIVAPPGPLPVVLKVADNIKEYKKELSECLDQCKLFSYCGELFNKLAATVMSSKATVHGQSCNAIAKQNLYNLHHSEKKISHVESIMSATLGSQEGTFDNIRMNTTGDQAQVIRGLLNKFAIRRVAMCCMTSGKGRKQHLVVSHDKGKLTVLQLSSLLKQADSNRRKLTLTRLGSATLPFTVLSLAINPCAEDYLAVCGLKECHVLSFNSSGQQADHLGLHPSVDSSGYIVKALWVPGSQTELAVVADTFVKMYDLSVDVISPSYYFIALTGKIMDATFVVTNNDKFLIAMMSNGTMYCQPIIPACSATDGPVYFTIDVQVKHAEMAEPVEGVILGGGASVYYSHALQLLFFSYSQGKSFVAHFHHTYTSFDQVFYIPLKSNGKNSPQALVQWTEVSNHPGLVFALLQSTSNPVVLLMKQEEIQVHELKVFSSKAKVQGMVALRQLSAGEKGSQPRTTFILLCEDGSLRIYLANNNDNNHCWLHPLYQPSSPLASLKFKARKKSKHQAHGQEALKFPIDFFEHCQQMQNEDVEFGGSDLLHVYNAQQIKNRFNSAGVYVVNTRMSGFSVEVSNNQHKNTVMVGVRVLLGSRSLDRAPSTIECFGRLIQVAFPSGTARWFDFPFTREESLTADKSFKINFGPSLDPSGVSFVDCIKAYCKAKDVFGWTEKSAADATASTAARMPAASSASKSSAAAASAATDDASAGVDESDEMLSMPINTKVVTSTDLLLCNVVTVLSNIYLLAKQESSPVSLAETISNLLTMNLPQRLQYHCKFMLATLLPDKEKYYRHKDETQLCHVINTLYDDITNIDSETFQYQLQVLLAIAKARPLNLAQLADSTFITKVLLASKAKIAIEELSSDRKEAGEASVQVSEDQDDQADQAAEEATTAKPVASAQLATVDVHADFISQMTNVFWKMYHQRPFSIVVAPIAPQGLIGVQTTVQAMVEVMWGFMEASSTNVIIVLPHIVEMLLSEDFQVSSSCAQTLMYLMRSRRKSIKPPVQDKTAGDDDKSKLTKPDQKPKDQTNGEGGSLSTVQSESMAGAVPEAPLQQEPPPPQQQQQQQESGQERGEVEDEEEEEGDDDEGEQESSQEVPAVQQQLEELLVAMQGVFENPAEIMEQFVQNPEQMMMMMQGILPALDPDAMLNLAISLSIQDGSQQQQQQGGEEQQEQEQQQEEEQPEPSDDVVHDNENELQDEEFYRCLDDAVEVPAPPEPEQEMPKVIRRPSLSSGTLTPPDMIIPLQSDEGNKQPSESTAGERATASSPVNEDGNVSSEPELAADSSGEEGQDPAVVEDIDQQINEDSTVDVAASSKQDDDGPEMERENKLQEIRLKLLEGLMERLSQLETVGGLRSIPFLQLLHALTGYLELPKPNKSILYKLLKAIINALGIKSEVKDASDRIKRSKKFEVHLLLVRFLNILLQQGKKRKEDSSSGTQSSSKRGQYLWFFTAKMLLEESNCMQFCYKVLLALLDIKECLMTKEEPLSLPGALLKAHVTSAPGDLSPFFQRQYVKGHSDDIFEPYHRLWAEIVLFLPCQLKKLSQCTKHIKQYTFSDSWTQKLCEFTMVAMQPAGIGRRYVRKLLLSVCGSKEKYRLVRDLHTLKFHLNSIKSICQAGGYNIDAYAPPPATLPYDTLLTLIEHFDACSEVATSRIHNWQSLCIEDSSVLPFLMRISLQLNEEMAPLIVKLITTALSGVPFHSKTDSHKHSHQSSKGTSSKSTDSSAKAKTTSTKQPTPDKEMCSALVQQLMSYELQHHVLSIFILTFLLQSNSSSLKWIVHSMMQHVYQGSNFDQQIYLLEEVMWTLWPHVAAYGNRASQFVDLLGYFSITANDNIMQKKPSLCKQFAEKAFAVLNLQNKVVSTHPNSHIYNQLSSLVDFDGYYLESEPCLICNDPEVPYSVVRLTSIKSEVRYSPTLILVRLTGSYMFSQISIKISDIKRTKMVRTINIYYTNRTVQNAIELKNKRNLWRKAKTCHLTAGQTEVKIDFSLPIVACNVMIEFAEFYDNLQASPEMLQCPRCSASVPAHPGVCGTCGENVYQCHKCRAINYDERDPFLCNSCGYSKYAKFETTVSGKSCAAVDPIENEEDRKKTLTSINTLLERADKRYKQLVNHKNELDLLLRCVSNDGGVTVSSSSAPGSTGVNKSIQSVAQRYCGDCKGTYHELSKLIRGVMASRKELVEYDRTKQMTKGPDTEPSTPIVTPSATSTTSLTLSYVDVQDDVSSTPSSTAKAGKCYGCASATIEYCITLLRALATLSDIRQVLVEEGLIQELVNYNQRSGSAKVQKEVRNLLCLLTKNNAEATAMLNEIILSRIMTSIASQNINPNFASAIHPEMLLLTACLEMEDSCWEQRLRAVVSLFQQTQHQCNPVVMEYVTLPCLNILKNIISPSVKPSSKAHEKKAWHEIGSVPFGGTSVEVDAAQWLTANPNMTFTAWKEKATQKLSHIKSLNKQETHNYRLMEKYGLKWKQKAHKVSSAKSQLRHSTWLRRMLFNSSSRSIRLSACAMVTCLCVGDVKKKEMLDLLASYLDEVGKAGENATEFLGLFQNLIDDSQWKFYLASRGILPTIGQLITKEINMLSRLEETSLSSDLSQGYALQMLTVLLNSFCKHDKIRLQYKNKLVGVVLNGYLALRRLVVQRTKRIDDTQDMLLELLENMTSGTEDERKEFMEICVKTLDNYSKHDMVTPIFIFERLCNIIKPETEDVGQFCLSLDKDPQQEEFLQGRMQGNPYSSTEPGLGPLMRDIKNKICTDCELVALLEDDSGMELLVCNKIISLDLPVKDVYKKIWCNRPNANQRNEVMHVVYRMRGLLGDATEDMVESLDSGGNKEEDEEEVYQMASVLAKCGGIEAMLSRLYYVKNLHQGYQLVSVILKLLGYCFKLKVNRQYAIQSQLNTLNCLLAILNRALCYEQDYSNGIGAQLAEKVLLVMESVLQEASSSQQVIIRQDSQQNVIPEEQSELGMLLGHTQSPYVQSTPSIREALMHVIPFLTFGDPTNMQHLISHFVPYLDFSAFDNQHSPENALYLDCFSVVANGISNDASGEKLKDLMIEKNMVHSGIAYIKEHVPDKSKEFESSEWKDCISRPSLPYVLKILTGLAQHHTQTQILVGEVIPHLHLMEQVSSSEHIGTMAENLLHVLSENETVNAKIKEVRSATRAEKKRKAMAMRDKELKAFGMTVNEKGQVIASSKHLKEMEKDLADEPGLKCCICLEGYNNQPKKVLGVYTYNRKVTLDEFENKARKTQGFCSVSHFNVIHFECHASAVKLAKGRDVWESAMLQNANTKCNAILPIWGPEVPETQFENCFTHHTSQLQAVTGWYVHSFNLFLHDLRLLLLRFAHEQSFSVDSGGGGPQSNMYYFPYVFHIGLYLLNVNSRSYQNEEKSLQNFLVTTSDKWVSLSYELDGPMCMVVMSLFLQNFEQWKETRIVFLKRLLILAHVRNVSPSHIKQLAQDNCIPAQFSIYKPMLILFALVNELQKWFKKSLSQKGPELPKALLEFIRNNNTAVTEISEKVLEFYQKELLPMESFEEFCDVAELLGDIPAAPTFLSDLLTTVVTKPS